MGTMQGSTRGGREAEGAKGKQGQSLYGSFMGRDE